MFQNKRFLTRGVQAEIPIELQLFLWNCIDQLPEERDYFQVENSISITFPNSRSTARNIKFLQRNPLPQRSMSLTT